MSYGIVKPVRVLKDFNKGVFVSVIKGTRVNEFSNDILFTLNHMALERCRSSDFERKVVLTASSLSQIQRPTPLVSCSAGESGTMKVDTVYEFRKRDDYDDHNHVITFSRLYGFSDKDFKFLSSSDPLNSLLNSFEKMLGSRIVKTRLPLKSFRLPKYADVSADIHFKHSCKGGLGSNYEFNILAEVDEERGRILRVSGPYSGDKYVEGIPKKDRFFNYLTRKFGEYSGTM